MIESGMNMDVIGEQIPNGIVKVSGAKNSVTKIMAASIDKHKITARRFSRIHHIAHNLRVHYNENRMLRRMQSRDQKGTGERYVTYLCTAGLGNRLAVHIAAHAYALRTQRQLAVSWIRNWHCGATFEDLFESVFPSRIPYRTKAILRESQHANSALVRVENPPEDLVAFDSRFGPFSDLHRLRAETPHVEDILAELRPRPDIISEVERFAEKFPRPIVGMHIRLGDFRKLGYIIPLERYMVAMEKIKIQFGFTPTCYVVSDGDLDDISPIMSKYPCIHHNFSAPRNTVVGIRQALITLLLLARTDVIIRTPLSTFGKVAVFWGGLDSIEA